MLDQIALVNHASILIESSKVKFLIDPWYFGTSFDDGWSLLYENNDQSISRLLDEVTHIYITHEHPDHFSIPFFKKHSNFLREKKVKILFQETTDKRVFNFIKELCKLDVIEVKEKKWFYLNPNIRFLIYLCGAIDSAIVIETKSASYININDCDFSKRTLREIEKDLNNTKPRLLLSQFSYAAWRSNNKWLKKAADYKLLSLKETARIIKSDLLVPFASYVYFSHTENKHLNKYVNTPSNTSNFLLRNKINFVFLEPYPNKVSFPEVLQDKVKLSQQNIRGTIFWKKLFTLEDKFFYGIKNNLNNHNIYDSANFFNRIKTNNNLWILYFIRFISLKRVFGDLFIYVNDTKESYLINFYKFHKIKLTKNKCHISMAGSTLQLILKQPFGLDTLTINGRFRMIQKNGFRNLVFCLGFVSLNSSGYGINLKSLFSFNILYRVISLPLRIFMEKS
jgi:hypothetical protein